MLADQYRQIPDEGGAFSKPRPIPKIRRFLTTVHTKDFPPLRART
jgi:hypothetical protein